MWCKCSGSITETYLGNVSLKWFSLGICGLIAYLMRLFFLTPPRKVFEQTADALVPYGTRPYAEYLYGLSSNKVMAIFLLHHWDKNVIILMKFSPLAALKDVILIISSAASDENCIRMKTFPFHRWWCHDIEMFYALLAHCEGNPPITDGFPSQRVISVESGCFLCCYLEKAVWQIGNMPEIRGTVMLRWHYSDKTCMIVSWVDI